jgi:glycosyltransferase involved in cell wall biosynthesis
LAGSPISLSNNSFNAHDETIFYFPSSFGIYKDHLTLLKAGLKLAEKNLNFKIILTGRETDNLVNGNISLSQQSTTKEYQAYITECNNFYQENQEFIQKYVKGCGYADYKDVEYYYQTCSCVVMPSTYEGFGLAIAEALLLGIPVIAANLEVYKEQVELYECPDRVEFFPAGDGEALAICLEKFILNPQPRLSPSEIAENIRSWTWDDVAREYIQALKALK